MIARVLFALGLATCVFSKVNAEELKPAYTFQYSGLKYDSKTDTLKPKGGSEAKVATTTTSVTGEDSYAWVTLGKWNFYLYPFTGGPYIGLSYMPTETLEVGSFLGLHNHTNDKDDTAETNASYLEPFVTYYANLGKIVLENYFSIGISQSSGKVSTGTPATIETSSTNTTGFNILITAPVPLGKNFWYVPSIKYSMASGKIKNVDGVAEGDVSSNGFNITLFALRTTFD